MKKENIHLNKAYMSEIAGKAALLESPTDVGAFANGLEALLSRRALCDSLLGKGLAQARNSRGSPQYQRPSMCITKCWPNCRGQMTSSAAVRSS